MDLTDYLNQKTALFKSMLDLSQQMARLSGNGSAERLLEVQERRDILISRIRKLDAEMGELPELSSPGLNMQAVQLKELVKRIADINEGLTVVVATKKQDLETESRQAAAARKYTRTGSL